MQYRKERTVHPFIRYNTMKRAIRCLCGSFLLCLLLSGCGRISETTEKGTDISVSSGESHSYEFLEDKNRRLAVQSDTLSERVVPSDLRIILSVLIRRIGVARAESMRRAQNLQRPSRRMPTLWACRQTS